MVSKLFSREHILKTILIVALSLTFTRLGVWQLSRLDERKEDNKRLRALLDAPPFSINEQTDRLTEKLDFRAEAVGEFDFDEQFVLLDQPNEYGDMGAKLIAPFVLEGTNQAILVDRGWIPQGLAELDSHTDLNEGITAVSGRLRKSTSSPEAMRFESAQYRWRRLTIPLIEQQISYELLPVYLQQSPIVTDVPLEPPVRFEPEYDLSNGPHMGYALQWFSFLIIGIVFYGAYLKKLS